MEKFKSVMTTIGQVLVIIGETLSEAAKIIAAWISNYFTENILPSMPTMLKFFSNRKANMVMFAAAAAYILIMNITALCMFGSDKRYAKRKEYRISEKRLMSVCFWGGAIGGIIGMNVFRHKTLKKKFSIGIPILFVIQLILHSFILGFLGFWAFF